MNPMKKTTSILGLALLAVLLPGLSSCHDFVFGNINIADEENPLIQKKTPTTGAEIYYGTEEGQHKLPINKDADIHNPDPDGALANWYTCLVMFKEGHSHYGGKLHGDAVYTRAAWKQEQFAEIHNTKTGVPEIVIDKNSVRTYVEEQRGQEGPNYFRLIGGSSKLWALCLYFYDKNGKLLNDDILTRSDEYQFFFSISDVDDRNQPYKVKDVRYRKGMPEGVIQGVEAKSFQGKDSFEERRKMTTKIFEYTYRDTWTHQDMGDGVRDFFNIRLLPPLTNKDSHTAIAEDQDCVGLKGHFRFDFFDYEHALDEQEWPLELSEKSIFGRKYKRSTYLLPQFYLAVRVMKCPKGKKAVLPVTASTRGGHKCAPFYEPNEQSGWKEVTRFNIPIKIYCHTFDSDPTNIDPYEPFYYHISREIGLSPEDAFEAASSKIGSGSLGFDAWFL